MLCSQRSSGVAAPGLLQVRLEILDRSDGGDCPWKSDVGEAVHERRYHDGLGVAHLETGAAVGAELR